MAVVVTDGSEILYSHEVYFIDLGILSEKNLFDPELGEKLLEMYTRGVLENIPHEYLDEIVDFATDHDPSGRF